MKSGNAKPISVLYQGVAPTTIQWANHGLIVPLKEGPPPGAVSGPDFVRFVDGAAVDQMRWRDPAHLAFANLDIQSRSRVESFIRSFGISGHFFNKDRDSGQWFIDPDFIRKYQKRLRKAWDGQLGQLWFHPRSVTVDARGERLVLVVRDLWTLICIGLLLDRERAKVCEHIGCRFLRYFLKARRDQQFCSKSCRALHNMQAWRANARNRKRERMQRRRRRRMSARKRRAAR